VAVTMPSINPAVASFSPFRQISIAFIGRNDLNRLTLVYPNAAIQIAQILSPPGILR
jgi:hypothetical protein